jgi:hypothetical protein
MNSGPASRAWFWEGHLTANPFAFQMNHTQPIPVYSFPLPASLTPMNVVTTEGRGWIATQDGKERRDWQWLWKIVFTSAGAGGGQRDREWGLRT